jgi:hypothetical protein
LIKTFYLSEIGFKSQLVPYNAIAEYSRNGAQITTAKI